MSIAVVTHEDYRISLDDLPVAEEAYWVEGAYDRLIHEFALYLDMAHKELDATMLEDYQRLYSGLKSSSMPTLNVEGVIWTGNMDKLLVVANKKKPDDMHYATVVIDRNTDTSQATQDVYRHFWLHYNIKKYL